MADETKFENFENYEAWIDAGILEVLRARNVMLQFMYPVNLPKGSNSKTLRKRNAQTAVVVGEAVEATKTVYSHSAMSTLTAKKVMVLNEISDEAILFANFDSEEVRTEQGEAVSEKVDVDSCALASGFTNAAGTTGEDLEVLDLEEALYLVGLSEAPGMPVLILANKQVSQIRKEIVQSGSAVWANPNVSSLLAGQEAAQNGWYGKYMSFDIYQTNHVLTSGGDRVGMCIKPNYALAVATVRAPVTEVERDSSKRTREVSTDLYFDAKERLDGAGCRIISKAS